MYKIIEIVTKSYIFYGLQWLNSFQRQNLIAFKLLLFMYEKKWFFKA